MRRLSAALAAGAGMACTVVSAGFVAAASSSDSGAHTPTTNPKEDSRAVAPRILISRHLAQAEDLAPGDEVRISRHHTGEAPRTFVVAGIYEPIPDPMQITNARREVRLHLPDLEDLLAARARAGGGDESVVDHVNLLLHDPAQAAQVAEELQRTVPGVAAQPAGGRPAMAFQVLERFHRAIALVTILGGTAFLLALMVMRAEERRETAGILRLLGCPRRRILWEVFLEGLLVTLPGALLGVLLAIGVEGMFNAIFQWRYDTTLLFVRVTPSIVWTCIALSVPLGVTAGLVASWSLMRKGILELIHK